MIGVPCTYSPDQHYIFEPELLAWCRRQTPDESLKKELFVYKQLQVGTFVIARWVSREMGLFVDLLNLGHALSTFTVEMAQELRRRILAPVTSNDTAKQMSASSSSRLHKLQEENGIERDRKARFDSNIRKVKGLYNP